MDMDKKYYVAFLIMCGIIMAFIFYINFKAVSEEKVEDGKNIKESVIKNDQKHS